MSYPENEERFEALLETIQTEYPELNQNAQRLKAIEMFFDYEPTDSEMMSSFGIKWHDGL